ncbi:MAG: VCBS repeat-containing protein [Planctomycetaceae bacterium]|nr:VCBS repeat-containing protein [Planctomycetaceae bacterium]
MFFRPRSLFARKRRPQSCHVAVAALERLEERTLLSSVVHPDVNFGTNGQIAVPTGTDAIVQPTGNVLVTRTVGVTVTSTSAVVERYLPSGALDTSFGNQGTVNVAPNYAVNSSTSEIVARPGGGAFVLGRLRIAGESSDRHFIAALTANGQLDTTFGYLGHLQLGSTEFDGFSQQDLSAIDDIAVDLSGRLLLLRNDRINALAAPVSVVQRFTVAGDADRSFGTNGLPNSDGKSALPAGTIGTDLAVPNDGRVLVGLKTTGLSFNAAGVGRLLANGAMDFGFGLGGSVLFPIQDATANLKNAIDVKVEPAPNGQIYFGFGSNNPLAPAEPTTVGVLRLTSIGTPDPTYTTGGPLPGFHSSSLPAPANTDYELADLYLEGSGKLIIGLDEVVNQTGTRAPVLVRLNPNSAFDVTFDDDGILRPFSPARATGAIDIKAAPDGKLFSVLPIAAPNLGAPPALLLSQYLTGNIPIVGRSDDLYILDEATGELSQHIAQNNGTFVKTTLANFPGGQSWDTVVGDFDGDTLVDFAGRDANGRWKVYSTSTRQVSDWGKWNELVAWDEITAVDLNGDGRDDIIGRQSATGHFWAALSLGTRFRNEYFGRWSPTGYVDLMFGDFSGDGKADVLGFRETGAWVMGLTNDLGNHFGVRYKGNWNTQANNAWTNFSVGDFDGDGIVEVAAMAGVQGAWWLGNFDGAGRVQTQLMNDTSDRSSFLKWRDSRTADGVLVGDFNRDGRDDIIGTGAAGEWLTLQGNPLTYDTLQHFGLQPLGGSSRSVVGDYDGDGDSDIVSLNLATGRLFTARSTGGFFQQFNVGTISGFGPEDFLGSGEILR